MPLIYKRKHTRKPTESENTLAVWLFWIIVGGMILAVLLGGCTPEEQRLRAADFGEDWMLAIDEVSVSCAHYPAMVIYRVGSGVYAVNGLAQGMAERFAWKDIDEIWLDDPEGIAPKKSLTPLMDAITEMCEGE
jgi:hypothetical protein